MDAMREQLNRPVVTGVAGFVLGVFIGLVLLGWWLWPVRWTDAGPEHLRTEFKEIYLRMAIDAHSANPDLAVAQQRVDEVGPEAEEILAAIMAEPENQDSEAISAFLSIARGEPVVELPPETTPEAGNVANWARILLPFMCLITFLLAGGLVALFLLRTQISSFNLPTFRKQKKEGYAPAPEYAELGQEPPIAQFMTTYNLGNDAYDDIFTIDSQTGEVLGECGVGIMEMVGVGEPKKVTAFDVWLYESKHTQTVTYVIASKYAYEDENIRQRLAARGEPVVVEPGRELFLETENLLLVARVVDMSYGSGPPQPESYFERLTLELVIWPRA